METTKQETLTEKTERVSIIGSEYRVLIKDHQRAILVDTETGNLEEWYLHDDHGGCLLRQTNEKLLEPMETYKLMYSGII